MAVTAVGPGELRERGESPPCLRCHHSFVLIPFREIHVYYEFNRNIYLNIFLLFYYFTILKIKIQTYEYSILIRTHYSTHFQPFEEAYMLMIIIKTHKSS